jgi:hypothetical protein
MNYSHERLRRPQRVLDPRQIASLNVKNANDDRIVGRTDEGGWTKVGVSRQGTHLSGNALSRLRSLIILTEGNILADNSH